MAGAADGALCSSAPCHTVPHGAVPNLFSPIRFVDILRLSIAAAESCESLQETMVVARDAREAGACVFKQQGIDVRRFCLFNQLTTTSPQELCLLA